MGKVVCHRFGPISLFEICPKNTVKRDASRTSPGFAACSTMELPFMDLATLAMAFPPCLSGKRPSLKLCNHEMLMAFYPCLLRKRQKIMESDKHELLIVCVHLRRPKHTFLPACRGKVSFCALAMDFSPCLPRKRDYLFAERQGGNSIVSTHQIHLVRLHAELFLDRKRAKSIASTRQVHEQRSLGITFLLKGRRESPWEPLGSLLGSWP